MSKVYIAEYAGVALISEGDNSYIPACPPIAEQKLDTTITTGAITALGAITAGSGYTNGTYANVPLTGGTGNGATANITVAGGAVTAVTLVNRGQAYTAADSLSASTAIIGGGTLFAIPVSGITIVSQPFNVATRFVEISVDGLTSVAFGTQQTGPQGFTPGVNPVVNTPIAAITNQRLNVNERVPRGVAPGAVLTVITGV